MRPASDRFRASVADPCTRIGAPSACFRAATSSRLRKIVVVPHPSTRSPSARVVDTTYFGMALYFGNSSTICGHTAENAW